MRIGLFAALWVDFAHGIPISDLLTGNWKIVEFYWKFEAFRGISGRIGRYFNKIMGLYTKEEG